MIESASHSQLILNQDSDCGRIGKVTTRESRMTFLVIVFDSLPDNNISL